MEVYNVLLNWSKSYEVIQSVGSKLPVPLGHCCACSACNKCMAGEMVVLQGNKIYCLLCFEKFFGSKCVSCLQSITGLNKMSFVFYNNQVWHNECFCCSICGKPLQGRPLIHNKESVYCRLCSDE